MSMLAAGYSWFNLIPGFNSVSESLASNFGNTWVNNVEVSSTAHLFQLLFSGLIVLTFAVLTRGAWGKSADKGVTPAPKFGAGNFVETILDGMFGMAEQILGSREQARRFAPLIWSLAMVIFFSNVQGLIPGFAPPTDNLNVTLAMGLVVFVVTWFVGIKDQGFHFVEHFLGPKIGGFWWLAPLMIPIELVAHVARPVSLGLRLAGNMIGDHMVLAIFLPIMDLQKSLR